LNKDGQKKARINACRITGKPEYDVAAWDFFRNNYLVPQGPQWYRTGFTPSPDSHYSWIYDWNHPDNNLLVHAAPRGTCKTTINLEDILRKIVAFPYWECVMFLSTQNFVSDRLGRMMDQIEHNGLIIDDFGKLRTSRGAGQWNRGSKMELNNGSKVWGFPLKGASLGTRPSGLIVMDDVEKSDDHVITPTDLREYFREFFFNAIYPMSRSPGHNVPIRILGTLYNRRMFIYWLYDTKDARIDGIWKRKLLNIIDMDWDVMGTVWQDEQKKLLGATSFNAQYMNNPGTASSFMLPVHPELCTYYLTNEDGPAYNDPFNSEAKIITHQLRGWHKDSEKSEPIPLPQRVERKWSDVVSKMRRFICVDPAFSTSPDSDYSVVHVMGFENSEEHRDTLYSLDIWWGRVRPEELTRIIYQLACRWQVTLVGAEAYNLRAEYYERLTDDLPGMYGAGTFVPKVIPIKFPPSVSKEAKIMGLEWRFTQFRIKLPIDRHERNKGYERLFWEIENATEDLALLDHDDCVDSLAMHLAIGKPHKAVGPDLYKSADPAKLLRDGVYTHESTGLSVLSGMNASEIPDDVLRRMMDERYETQAEAAGLGLGDETWDEEIQTNLAWMGLPRSMFY
jgi:hypothetical protein